MNRLAEETSPYLRQHADNPVDWHPWGEAAFALARDTDRPVFLSVGYSACHWCHVMAHESFEDEAIAATLNASFVSVKVDREERPDVDAVYMEAVQSLTGSGGWPMSVFMTPDGRPFFGGTYFPPTDRYGMPSFATVLAAMADVWANRRADVEAQADELRRSIAERSLAPARTTRTASSTTTPTTTTPDNTPGGTQAEGRATGRGASTGPFRSDLLSTAVRQLGARFDATWGGFGPAPKFPQPSLLDLALEQAQRGDPTARQMATVTLDAMAAGGIHDHLGGGFARYSTDTEWLVPHFEKMLYDQAGLLRTYVHGWKVTGNPAYLTVAQGIVDYVARDLAAPGGGLYAAEDADSEGVEGKFYVWTPEQLTAVLGPELAAAAGQWFGVTREGNFDGATILRRPLGAPMAGTPEIEAARSQLLQSRSQRVRPGLDDKVLTEWNAMYGSALAEAAALTGNATWAAQAQAIGEFLWSELRRADGRWLRSWQAGGGARHLAYAADYGWVVDCSTRLGELTGRAIWTERAVEAAGQLLQLFYDPDDGGFFTTGQDAEALIVRTKDLYDGATPSANAVCSLALVRLGSLTGDTAMVARGASVVELLGPLIESHPTAFAHSLLAARMAGHGATEVVVAGNRPDLVQLAQRRWSPGAVLAWGERISSPLWEGRSDGQAYVCRHFACAAPAKDEATFAAQLAAAEEQA